VAAWTGAGCGGVFGHLFADPFCKSKLHLFERAYERKPLAIERKPASSRRIGRLIPAFLVFRASVLYRIGGMPGGQP